MATARPPSVNLGPLINNNLFYSKYIVLYFFQMWVAGIPVVFWAYICYLNLIKYWWAWLLVPLYCLELYWMYILTAALIAKIMLFIVCKIYPPREGVFKIDETKDYFYWSLRAFIRSFPFTLIRYSAFPWLDLVIYNFLSGSKYNKCKLSSVMYDGWVDTEFIEVGKNCMIGLGSIVLSHYIDGDRFILKKVKLNDGAIVGAKAIVMPGTELGEHTTLGAASITEIDQKLEPYSIYMGMPAKKLEKG